MSKAVIINENFPQIAEALKRSGVNVLLLKANKHLPVSLASHVDMNFFVVGDEIFIAGGAEAGNVDFEGYKITELRSPGDRYPYDVICNGKLVGEHLFCNVRTIDNEILKSAKKKNLNIIHVRQGYTGCSICSVTDNAIITSDSGIAKAAAENGIDVLLIDNSDILLPGYDVGFIGGCTGLLSDNELLFSGSLDECSFGKDLKSFCESYGVSVIELTESRPVDIGGFLVIETAKKGLR